MMPYLLAIFGGALGAGFFTGIVYIGYRLGGTRMTREQAWKVFGVLWLILAITRIVHIGNTPQY